MSPGTAVSRVSSKPLNPSGSRLAVTRCGRSATARSGVGPRRRLSCAPSAAGASMDALRFGLAHRICCGACDFRRGQIAGVRTRRLSHFRENGIGRPSSQPAAGFPVNDASKQSALPYGTCRCARLQGARHNRKKSCSQTPRIALFHL
jgi:hypothetical protein